VKTLHDYEQYVPSLDKWIIRENMSTARHGLASATVDGNIYVIGGSVNPGASAVGNLEIFSPIDWRTISENKNP